MTAAYVIQILVGVGGAVTLVAFTWRASLVEYDPRFPRMLLAGLVAACVPLFTLVATDVYVAGSKATHFAVSTRYLVGFAVFLVVFALLQLPRCRMRSARGWSESVPLKRP